MVKRISGLALVVCSLFSNNASSGESNYSWRDNSPGVYSNGSGGFVVVSEVKDSNVVDTIKLRDNGANYFRSYLNNNIGADFCWRFNIANTSMGEYGTDGNYGVKARGCLKVNDMTLDIHGCSKEVGFILDKKIKRESSKLKVVKCD